MCIRDSLSIGQGPLLATPLQVAHMMAGVANGYLPRLQLIKQIQDGNSNVVYAPRPQEVQRPLPDYEKALASVRKGMKAVIEGGTGGRARLSYSSIAGKSGTAQWGPEREDKRDVYKRQFLHRGDRASSLPVKRPFRKNGRSCRHARRKSSGHCSVLMGEKSSRTWLSLMPPAFMQMEVST